MIKRNDITLILVVISLLLASSNIFYVYQTNQDLKALRDELTAIKSINQSEVFPGEEELYSKARQEGALIVYTVWDTEDIVGILQGFSNRYPDIKVEYWSAKNSEIVARAIAEFQADQKSFDIVLSDSAPPVLRAAGAIAPYETAQKDFLQMHDPTMPVVSLQIKVLAYNTNLLTQQELPTGWKDVANQKYRGIVALDDPMRAGPLSHILVALKDVWKNDTRWTMFVEDLKLLDVPVYKSTSEMLRLVVAGEYAIAMPALLHDILFEKERGAPIDFISTADPIVTARYGAIYSKAPHPNAAKLFAEWLISPEGQGVMESVGRETVRIDFPSRTSIETVFGKEVKSIKMMNQDYLSDPKAWLDKYVKPIWLSS
ncbi:ABC transporter substrate-binding protein [[Eubacterium] cellulosolvens]